MFSSGQQLIFFEFYKYFNYVHPHEFKLIFVEY